MDWLRILFSRCLALFRTEKLNLALEEELRAHIDLAIADNLRRGMTPEEARTEALRSFGGVAQVEEVYRQQRGLPWLSSAMQDIRFGARMLIKNPGFTLVAILTLALGIGGNTAIFSIVNGVLLNPLPFPQADRLVALHESKIGFPNGSIPYVNFLDWQRQNHSFSSMAVARGYVFSLTGRGDAEQVNAQFISADFFTVLGLNPILGRTFLQSEEQPAAAPVALISEGLWRRKFSASTSILGNPVTLDGRNYTIVGVIPSSFHLQFSNFSEQDVYVPIRQWNNPLLLDRGAGLAIHGIARLRPGVTLKQAQADMDTVTHDLAVAYPEANEGTKAKIIPLKEQMVGDVRPFLLVLLCAIGFVLLIACVNVASLLLARSVSRGREFAVRAALGASRGRVIRQLITESLLLGLIAGAISLLPAIWGTHAAIKILPAALPRTAEIGVDFRVLAFTMVVSLLTSLLFGLVPALRVSQRDPQGVLKESGRGAVQAQHRTLGLFVVIEMAVALVLLVGSGLMIRSFVALWSVDPGFNPHNVLTFGFSFPPTMKDASSEKIRAAYRDVVERLASVPGVKAVSPVWGALPMAGDDERLFWLEGQARPASDKDMNWAIDYIVGPDYLRVMQIPLLRGRFFTQQDNERAPLVAVIDEVFARKYFAEQDPIGKRIHLSERSDDVSVEIVGLVPHVKQWGLDLDDGHSLRAQIYLPSMQMPDSFLILSRTGSGMILRYEGALTAIADGIRLASRQMSVDQVIAGNQTMDSIISDSIASRRLVMILLGAFAGMALLLACVGIYGVMAYLVSQRTQEIGIRMALGAQKREMLLLVLRRGAWLAVAGVVIGMGLVLLLTRLMHKLLFHVSATDPAVLAGVSGLLIVIALIACFVPARRAASIDPMRALRTE